MATIKTNSGADNTIDGMRPLRAGNQFGIGG
jgi:hypothetical protein